jgi:hypothetical protein
VRLLSLEGKDVLSLEREATMAHMTVNVAAVVVAEPRLLLNSAR